MREELRTKIVTIAWSLVFLIGISALSLFFARLVVYNYVPKIGMGGKVVDKRTDFFDTNYGSWARRNLIVEEKIGNRVPIRVDEKTFQNAQIGMWLEVENDGIKLRWSQSKKNQ